MDARKLLTVFSDQREELRDDNLSLMCTRLEERQLSLNSNLAQVVIGVRRSGKSTICEKFLRQNNVNFAYANFDDDRLSDLKTEILMLFWMLYIRYMEISNICFWMKCRISRIGNCL